MRHSAKVYFSGVSTKCFWYFATVPTVTVMKVRKPRMHLVFPLRRVTTLPFSSCGTQRRFLLSCIHTKCDAATSAGLAVDCVGVRLQRHVIGSHSLTRTALNFRHRVQGFKSAKVTPGCTEKCRSCITGIPMKMNGVHFVAREQPKPTTTHCHTSCSPLQTSTVPQLQRNSTYILFRSTHNNGHFFCHPFFHLFTLFFFPSPCVVNVVSFFFFFFYGKETSFVCDKAAGGKKAQLRQEKFYIKAQTAVVLID